ncbi:helix-turn-helix transcriptional regulator [Microbacterium album]|nr:LuxR C-terminal-related transcriptional regulator [Microbacterium album]
MTGPITTHEAVPRIARPQLPRHALLRRLAETEAVAILHGSAGAGKTTLLVQWAGTLPDPVAWHEPGDDGDLPFDVIEEQAATGAVLLVDRAERLSEDAIGRLGRLVDSHRRVRVALATRSARTARHMAEACDAPVTCIGPDELRVTSEELAEAAPDMPAAQRDALLADSEGSVTAVRAALDDGGDVARARLRRRLLDELAQRPELRDAVLAMTLLERVDPDVLAAWGMPWAAAMEAEDAGLATSDGDTVGLTPLVRGLLAPDAEMALPAAHRRRLLTDAVHASLIRTQPLAALRVALGLRDFELATAVAFANWVDLLEQLHDTYAVFAEVPGSDLRGYPALIVMRALLSNMMPSTRLRALQLLASESVFQRVQPSRGSHRDRVMYRAFEACALRVTPLADHALPLLRRAIDDYTALAPADMESLGRLGPMLYVHLGISAMYLGDEGLAQWCFEIGYAKHREAGRADVVDPLSMRAGLAAWQGDLPAARQLLAEADAAEWPPGWRASSPADFFHLGMAIVAVEDGDPDAAQAWLEEAGRVAEIVEHWPMFAIVQARRDIAASDAATGLMRLRALRSRRGQAPTTSGARSLLDIAEADLRLALGDLAHARRLAARGARHRAAGVLALARVEFALGREAEAMARVGSVLATPDLHPRGRLEAELLAAAIALRTGRADDADLILLRVAGLLRETGLRAPLMFVSSRDRLAMAERMERAGVVEAAVLREPRPSVLPDDAPESLSPRELAVLRALTEAGSVDEVAARLYVSRNTVKSQLRSLYRKLGVGSRTEALSRATALGLLEGEEAGEGDDD